MKALKVDISWRYSDDTVMHIATAKALLDAKSLDIKDIGTALAKKYKQCWNFMAGRAPGKSTGKAVKIL